MREKIKLQWHRYVSQLKGMWFKNHNLLHSIIWRFVAYWVLLKPSWHKLLVNKLGLPDHAVVDWSNYSKCVILITQQSEKISGFGKVVEVDKAKIMKCKYDRDGLWKLDIWWLQTGHWKVFSDSCWYSWSRISSASDQRLYTAWYNNSRWLLEDL